jgi:hypothetical protein
MTIAGVTRPVAAAAMLRRRMPQRKIFGPNDLCAVAPLAALRQ